ncbi:MAG TPA: Spy/CpxP family protein refolding chaperone, partial [Armatimonadota bacterium]|nr:Spy/CpxP family protein refolding chaperone [Armatimonadota bacterium]
VKEVLNAEQQTQLATLLAEARELRSVGPGLAAQLAGLNLTAEQKTKVKEIGAKYQPEMSKLRASLRDATDKAPIQAQLREQQTKMTDEVKAALTPEQAQKLTPVRRRQNQ